MPEKELEVSLFKAKDYIDGMSIPAIEGLDGKVYKGRLLSFEEVLPLQGKLEALQSRGITTDETKKIVSEICTLLGIPPEVVLQLPPKAMMQAVLHFFRSMFGESSSNGSSNKEPPTNTSA